MSEKAIEDEARELLAPRCPTKLSDAIRSGGIARISSKSALAAIIAALRERDQAVAALEKIKLLTVTCGAPGEPTTADALSKMLRICIDAGVTKGLSELRGAVDR